MPSDTTVSTEDYLAPPPILDGDELYDFLMEGIEPELMNKNLPKIGALTKNETVEQRKVRVKRYAEAFTEFDARLTEYKREWDEMFAGYKRDSAKMAEELVSSAEADEMKKIEKQMSQS